MAQTNETTTRQLNSSKNSTNADLPEMTKLQEKVRQAFNQFNASASSNEKLIEELEELRDRNHYYTISNPAFERHVIMTENWLEYTLHQIHMYRELTEDLKNHNKYMVKVARDMATLRAIDVLTRDETDTVAKGPEEISLDGSKSIVEILELAPLPVREEASLRKYIPKKHTVFKLTEDELTFSNSLETQAFDYYEKDIQARRFNSQLKLLIRSTLAKVTDQESARKQLEERLSSTDPKIAVARKDLEEVLRLYNDARTLRQKIPIYIKDTQKKIDDSNKKREAEKKEKSDTNFASVISSIQSSFGNVRYEESALGSTPTSVVIFRSATQYDGGNSEGNGASKSKPSAVASPY